MDNFADIRPYRDEEVTAVLDRLLADRELAAAIAGLNAPRLNRALPWLVQPLVRTALRRQCRGVSDVRSFQMLIKTYMDRMIERSTSRFTVSGLEHLAADKPYLLMSNHRDIALDPAFVNYALYHNDHDTVRIAIGDNLLSKPFAADLMRLNKSFIVKRSAKGPRQMLAAYRELSSYIRHSLQEERASIWIAQREGRAKDGCDRTEPAIIKMLSMSQRKNEESFAEFIAGLNIVPVSISYEWDPCDAAKARELSLLASEGHYEKAAFEDLASIATGVQGQKGHVHVSFGRPLAGDFSGADAVAAAVDRQVIEDYVLHPSNFHAYRALVGDERWRELSGGYPAAAPALDEGSRAAFEVRMAAMPEAHRQQALAIYANPVIAKLALCEGGAGEQVPRAQ